MYASLFNEEGIQSEDSGDDFNESFLREAAQQSREIDTAPRSEWRPSIDAESHYRSALRDAARILDLRAADLEDIEAYEQADDLRKRAQSLRSGARIPSDGETAN